MSHVQNDTRKIVKPKDITEAIARMMILDLRPFDIVEGVGFNELFILVTSPFPNSNFFGNPDSFKNPYKFENPDKFENLEIFGYPSRSRRNFVFPTRPDISGSRAPLIDEQIITRAPRIAGNKYIFQRDNAAVHTAKALNKTMV